MAEAATDLVAKRRTGWTVRYEIEFERIVSVSSDQDIAARTADQRVVPAPPTM